MEFNHDDIINLKDSFKKLNEAKYGEAEIVQIDTPEAFAKWFNLGLGQPNSFHQHHMMAGENLYAVSLPNDGIEAMIAVPPHGREIHGADKQNNPLTPEDLNLIRAAIGEQIPGFNA